MGLLLLDKNADFSAVSLGHAGLYTSVLSGLLALHETRSSSSKAAQNSAPDGTTTALVTGSPTFSATNVAVTTANQINFGVQPGSSNNTFALVLKIKSTGATSDCIAGAIVPATAIAAGGCYFLHGARRVTFSSTLSTTPGAPLAYAGNTDALINLPADGSTDGTYEMFVAVLENQVSLRLHRPKTNTVYTAPITAGRYFAFTSSAPAFTTLPTTLVAQNLSLFAQWSRVLTPTEIATFYAEMKSQLGLLGLSI